MRILILCLLLLSAAACTKPTKATAQTSAPRVPVSKAGAVWSGDAQSFIFYTLAGQRHELKDYAGTPLVLNFWADWCGPCKAEFPAFQQVHSAYKGQFALVSITDSSSTDPAGYVKQNGYDWTFGLSDAAGRLYGVRGIPTTVFINRSGTVKDTVVGGIDQAEFEKRLKQIL
jgi:cytochrome c biogenesis protein CcmG, thiol:disulfide interchange protein DsbE